MSKKVEKKVMNFVEWYDYHYTNDEDANMKSYTYQEVVGDIYKTCKKDYSEAYYYLADVFEEYLDYIKQGGGLAK